MDELYELPSSAVLRQDCAIAGLLDNIGRTQVRRPGEHLVKMLALSILARASRGEDDSAVSIVRCPA